MQGSATAEEIIAVLSNLQKNNITEYTMKQLIAKLSEEDKIMLLHNENLRKSRNLATSVLTELDDSSIVMLIQTDYEFLKDVFGTMQIVHQMIGKINIEARLQLLKDNDLILNKLGILEQWFGDLIKDLPNNEDRCVDFKKGSVLNNENLVRLSRISILASLDINDLIEFISTQRRFFEERNIKVCEIICEFGEKKKIEFIDQIESINLTTEEKKEILATLPDETKKKVKERIPHEYLTALTMSVIPSSELNSKSIFDGPKIKIDFNRPPEDYIGLDRVIFAEPQTFTEEQRAYFKRLCGVCPNIDIYDSYHTGITATVQEYLSAEEWIESVIASIPKSYTTAQKIAMVDHAIGKKLSYSPDFEDSEKNNFTTEVFDSGSAKNVFHVLSEGNGICGVISKAEKYLLQRLGIECQLVSSGKHVFLKIHNIEVECADGTIIKGNTILDPTWNLSAHRFSICPTSFFISYEEARKNDIDENGIDRKCHQNDAELRDATLMLDKDSLKKLFHSVGLTDKKGEFLAITEMFAESVKIWKYGQVSKEKLAPIAEVCPEFATFQNDKISTEKKISLQLALIAEVCPEFATCQNESMFAITQLMGLGKYMNELEYNNAAIDRVYRKNDPKKRPTFFVYMDTEEFGKKFWIPREDGKGFQQLEYEEFVSKFECYQYDIKQNGGLRMWEETTAPQSNTQTEEAVL